jgi:hypothetical protein
MNVQLAPAALERAQPVYGAAIDGLSRTPRPARVQSDAAVRVASLSTAPSGTPQRIAFAAQQGELNRHATAAQRALDFIDDAQAQLKSLKSALSAGLSARVVDPARIAAQIERFDAHWAARASATGNTIDASLRFDPEGSARQVFAVRALDPAVLRSGGSETLTFHPQGLGKRAASVSFDAAPLAADALARRLDRALAPVGVRVELGPGDAMRFSVAEASWPAVRDGMMIEGGGKRFPGGRPGRAAVDAVPGAIEPRAWSVADRNAQRATLRSIVQADDRLGDARRSVKEALTRVEQAIRGGTSQAGRAGEMSNRFGDAIGKPDSFEAAAKVVSTLKGMNRDRVRALLKAA